MSRYLWLVCLLAAGCYPNLKTTGELSAWSKCQPGMIGDYICAKTAYPLDEKNRHKAGQMEDEANCLGRAQMAQEALSACGYEARIASLCPKDRTPGDKCHAVALFTNPKNARRGFVDCRDVRTYKPGTPWEKIIEDVRPEGKWKEQIK